MELHELIENINDQQSFYVFVEALISDWRKNQNEWENGNIEMFLEASVAWSKDSKLNTDPSWRAFAEFLYAGKYYE